MVKRYNLFFFVLGILLLIPNISYAFIPPDSLAITVQVLASSVLGFFILISINAVLFVKKIGAYRKFVLWFSVFITLIMGIMLFANRYNTLIEINGISNDDEGLMDVFPLQKNEINLSKLAEKDIEAFTVFQVLTTLDPIVKVKNAVSIELVLFIKEIKRNPDVLFSKYGVSNTDKILFVCYTGFASKVLMYALKERGYNAYFARLNRVTNSSVRLFDAPYIKKKLTLQSIVVMPLKYRSKFKKDLYISFNNISDIKDYISVAEAEKARVIAWDRCTKDILLSHNIIVTSNLHCVLVKYLMDYLGIHKGTIYKHPVTQAAYDKNIQRLDVSDWCTQYFDESEKFKIEPRPNYNFKNSQENKQKNDSVFFDIKSMNVDNDWRKKNIN